LVREVIEKHPSFGLRRITAMVRKNLSQAVNRKKIHRILKINGWQIHKKPQGMRPRAQGYRSRASSSDERWAIDTTTVMCGRDGWAHLTAIIDCFDRQIVGWRFSRSGVATVAAATLEDALRDRKPGSDLLLRSDNGLVFGSRAFSCETTWLKARVYHPLHA
jgi:putative transposase